MVSRLAKRKRTPVEIFDALPKVPEAAGFKPLGIVSCHCASPHTFVVLRCQDKEQTPIQRALLMGFVAGARARAPELQGTVPETWVQANKPCPLGSAT